MAESEKPRGPLRGCGFVWLIFFLIAVGFAIVIALLFTFPSYL